MVEIKQQVYVVGIMLFVAVVVVCVTRNAIFGIVGMVAVALVAVTVDILSQIYRYVYKKIKL